MIIFLDYTLNINYLLTNNSLLELSFNQILDSPNNLLFHINLNQNLKKNKKLCLLKKISQLLKNEKQQYINFLNFYLKNKEKSFVLKNFLIINLVIKQLIANILYKIFEFHLIKKLLPLDCFYIADNNLKAHRKLNIILKKINFGFQFDKVIIFDKIKLIFILKIIEQQILDIKFIFFLKKLLLVIKKTKLFFDKASKFYQIICNIYLSQFDFFLIRFLKNRTLNSFKWYELYNRLIKTKSIELLILKALSIKNNNINLQYILNFKNQKLQLKKQLYYIRYLDNIFIGGSLFSLNNLKLVLKFFFKSNLYFKIAILNWKCLNKSFINFLAKKKKKVYKFFFKTKTKCVIKPFIQEFAPLKSIKKQFYNLGLIKKNNKSKIMTILINLYTKSIIIWYNFFFRGLMIYYTQTINYKKLISNVQFFLKWSLLYTLKKKHKKSLYKIIIKYWSHKNFKLIKRFILNHRILLCLQYIYLV